MARLKTSRSHAPTTAEVAFRAFIRTSGLFRNTMGPYFARFGISSSQWGVLRVLHRAEGEGLENLRLTDLGQRLLVKPPSVTTLIDRLERMGMVDRTTSAGDQRAKQVRLTPAGRQLVERVLLHHPKQVHKVMQGLSSAEQKQLQQLMQRLGEHLESMDAGRLEAAGEL